MLVCLLICCLSGLPAFVHGDPGIMLAQTKTAEEAAREAKKQYGGKVLSIELDESQRHACLQSEVAV